MAIISKERFILSIQLNANLKPPEPLNEPEPVTKGERMPIRDKEKAREYKRLWIANKRKQNVEPVEPIVEPSQNVEPSLIVEPALKVEPRNNFVEPWHVEPVEPKAGVEPRVEPSHVEPKSVVEPCPLNHHSLAELFKQASEQVKSAWIEIKSQGGTEQCSNCHHSQSNHQLALNLLEKYWIKVKRLEKGEPSM